MKHLRILWVVCLFIAATTVSPEATAQTGDEERAIGVARGALQDCLAGTQSNLEVNANATFGNGTWTVTFFGQPRCRPGEICPLFVILLATAELDEDFNVISTNCRISSE